MFLVAENKLVETHHCSSHNSSCDGQKERTFYCNHKSTWKDGQCDSTKDDFIGCFACSSGYYYTDSGQPVRVHGLDSTCEEPDTMGNVRNIECPSGVCHCHSHRERTETIIVSGEENHTIVEEHFTRGLAFITDDVSRVTNQTTVFCDDRFECDAIGFDYIPCEFEVTTTTTVATTTTSTTTTTTTTSSTSVPAVTTSISTAEPTLATSHATSGSSSPDLTVTTHVEEQTNDALRDAVISLSVICFLLVLGLALFALHHRRIARKMRYV